MLKKSSTKLSEEGYYFRQINCLTIVCHIRVFLIYCCHYIQKITRIPYEIKSLDRLRLFKSE